MRTTKPVLVLALLLSAAAFAEDDLGLGPWRPGMSREQVVALADGGPYKDAAAGTVETESAPFGAHKVKAAFTFGAAGLATIQMQSYTGSDWREAEKSALEVFDHFKAKLGGANVKDVSDNIERDELDLILRQTLGTAEAMNKRYAQNGQYVIQTFDMVPLKQPADVRLHCQWIYDGRSNTYSVFLYQDLPGAPKRDAAENVQIKKL